MQEHIEETVVQDKYQDMDGHIKRNMHFEPTTQGTHSLVLNNAFHNIYL